MNCSGYPHILIIASEHHTTVLSVKRPWLNYGGRSGLYFDDADMATLPYIILYNFRTLYVGWERPWNSG